MFVIYRFGPLWLPNCVSGEGLVRSRWLAPIRAGLRQFALACAWFLVVRAFVHFVRSFFVWFRSFLPSFVGFVRSFVRVSFVSFVRAFVRSCFVRFVRSRRSFMSFVRSFACSFVRSFRSFVSFVRSFRSCVRFVPHCVSIYKKNELPIARPWRPYVISCRALYRVRIRSYT